LTYARERDDRRNGVSGKETRKGIDVASKGGHGGEVGKWAVPTSNNKLGGGIVRI